MIQSIRQDVVSIIDRADQQGNRDNLSLYLNRLCRKIDDPDEKEHNAKKETLQSMLRGFTSDTMNLYKHAFQEWQQTLVSGRQCLFFEMETETPLIVGKGDHNVHEFGIALQTPWSTPVIPGSAVKGVLSSFAAGYGGDDWNKGNGAEMAGQHSLVMFGGQNQELGAVAGGIRFMDAWWVPNSQTPFMEDIINVHYRSYYQKGEWPHGMDSPVPNSFLVIRPGQCFLFAVQGPEGWCNLARQILKKAAKERGFGAKTRVGYGRLSYCKTTAEFKEEMRELYEVQLAELYSAQAGNADLRESFAHECKRRKYSPVLHKLFMKFRPAAVFLAELMAKPDLQWQGACNIRKQYSSQLPAGKIDTTDSDIQAIFKVCMLLVQGGEIADTWLARFAPSAEDVLQERSAEEIQSLLLDYRETWPPLVSFRQAIEKLALLSNDEKEECLTALELRMSEA